MSWSAMEMIGPEQTFVMISDCVSACHDKSAMQMIHLKQHLCCQQLFPFIDSTYGLCVTTGTQIVTKSRKILKNTRIL